MRTIVAVTLLSLTLSGCRQLADYQAQRAAEHAAEDAETCKTYGFAAGTDAFAQCLQDRDDQRRADARAAAIRANQPPPTVCSTIGAQVICKSQ